MAVTTAPPLRLPEEEQTGAPAGSEHPWRPVVVALAGLLLGALVNADALVDIADRQPLGWRRDALVEVADGVQDVGDRLHLTDVRRWSEDVLDRDDGLLDAPETTSPPTTAPAATVPASAPDGGSSPTTATTVAAELRVPSAAEPLRLWIVGDSMMQVVGQSLVNTAIAHGAVDADLEFRVSTGLTRPDYFDWPARLAEILSTEGPESIVVMFGANDAQGIVTADGPQAFGTDAWLAEYRTRTAALMDVLAADGRRIYWVGQPIMRSDRFSARMAALDEIYRSEADRRPQVTYVDTWSLFAVDGRYSAYLDDGGGSTLVRQTDGIHLTRAGGDLVARAVMDRIEADWFREVP